MHQVLTIGVCMCDGMTLSDFIPPMEILTSLNFADHPLFTDIIKDVPYRLKVDYLAPSMNPVFGTSADLPTVNPTQTYDSAMKNGVQFDILFMPAGPYPELVDGGLKDVTPAVVAEFIKSQAPGAKYIMSVCGGSLTLAAAGVLDGKRATTNKAFFRVIQGMSNKTITWVPKARWVVDGKIWTSSGVSAGQDMALAFLEHLTSQDIAQKVRGLHEVREIAQEEDPFAEVHGLV